jgi:gas vesicle structural protein
MAASRGGGYLSRPAPSGLADVIEIILDKGIVIDAYVRVSLLGIELLTIDARVVVASVDTYLRFAEATNRLDLREQVGTTVPDLLEDASGAAIEHVAARVVEKKVEGVKDAVVETVEDVRDKARDILTPGDG